MFLRPCIIRKVMENIVKNALLIEKTTQHLKQELVILRNAYNELRIDKLSCENDVLNLKITRSLKKLIQLETNRGIKQISVPDKNTNKTIEETKAPDAPITSIITEKTDRALEKTDGAPEKSLGAKKDKKKADGDKKEKKQSESKKKPDVDLLPIDVGRLDLRVGKILKAEKHPDAESLYVSQIECGDEVPRTVVSGLVKFVPLEELQGRMVVVLCNLKPAKMRGVLSEAMVMCASTPEAVEVLLPPVGSKPGDPVECSGFTRQPDAQLNPKKKIFETVAPDLKTNDSLEACYQGKSLMVAGKSILTKSLKNVQIK